MPTHRSQPLEGAQRFAFILLSGLLVTLWFAGGASRADVFGQAVCRAAAWIAVLCAIVFLPPPRWRLALPVTALFFAAVGLVLLQLIPLPPALWSVLPGHGLLARLGTVAPVELGWQPLTISRQATLNSLFSLVVPGAILALLTILPQDSFRRVLVTLIALVLAACILGLFQFTGAQFDHPMINDIQGEIGGPFANRNHFALFAAIGTLLAPAYAFAGGGNRWTPALAGGFGVLCLLLILAVGSRAGMVLGAIGIPVGLLMVRSELAALVRRTPSKMVLAIAAASAVVVALAVAASVMMGRAQSLARLQAEGSADGLRGLIRPTVFEMIGKYFPFGSGFGTFDPAYRIDEPAELLGPRYVNQAHNDLLQVPLDGGLLGGLLLLAALAWWLYASLKAWRAGGNLQGRLGSAILLLVIVASALDYPARTPLIMAMTIIAGVWLATWSIRHRPARGRD